MRAVTGEWVEHVKEGALVLISEANSSSIRLRRDSIFQPFVCVPCQLNGKATFSVNIVIPFCNKCSTHGTKEAPLCRTAGMCFQLIHRPRTISKGLCQIYIGSAAKGSDLLHQDNAEHKQKHQSCIFRKAKSIHQWNVSHIIWAYGCWCYWIGLKIDVTTTQSLSTMATVVWQA